MSATAIPIHIDTDPGTDDLLALAVALGSPELRVVGITTVAGNAPLEVVTDNALRFVTLAGGGIEVGAGASHPLHAPPVTAEHVHGSDGRLGTPLPPSADDSGDAREVLRRSLQDHGARQVVALGPLTNVARLLETEPGLLDHVEIIWMGGTLSEGNVTPAAEFNCYADPDAAALVLGGGLPVRVVGLDVTHRVVLRSCDAPPGFFGLGRRSEMLSSLVSRLLSTTGTSADPSVVLHDPCAVAACFAPELFRFDPMHLSVRTDPPNRGRLVTVESKGRSSVRYATEVQGREVVLLCLERLKRWAGAIKTEEDRCPPSP